MWGVKLEIIIVFGAVDKGGPERLNEKMIIFHHVRERIFFLTPEVYHTSLFCGQITLIFKSLLECSSYHLLRWISSENLELSGQFFL